MLGLLDRTNLENSQNEDWSLCFSIIIVFTYTQEEIEIKRNSYSV